jgi:hypothetical protein
MDLFGRHIFPFGHRRRSMRLFEVSMRQPGVTPSWSRVSGLIRCICKGFGEIDDARVRRVLTRLASTPDELECLSSCLWVDETAYTRSALYFAFSLLLLRDVDLF